MKTYIDDNHDKDSDVQFAKFTEQKTVKKEIDTQGYESVINGLNEHVPSNNIDIFSQIFSEVLKNYLNCHTVGLCFPIVVKEKFRIVAFASDNNEINTDHFPFSETNIFSQTLQSKKIQLYSYITGKEIEAIIPYYKVKKNIRSIVSMPVFYEDSIKAILFADSPTKNFFTDEHIKLLVKFSRYFSSVFQVYTIRKKETEENKYSIIACDYVKKMNDNIHHRVASKMSHSECLKYFIQNIKKIISFESVTVALENSSSNLMIHESYNHEDVAYLKSGKAIDKHSICYEVFSENIPFGIIDDVSVVGNYKHKEDTPHYRFYQHEPTLHYRNSSMAIFNLMMNDKNVGCVVIENHLQSYFTGEIIERVGFFVDVLSVFLHTMKSQEEIALFYNKNIYHPVLFKRYVDLEVYRAHRDEKPISLFLISLDNFSLLQKKYTSDQLKGITNGVLSIINASKRRYELITMFSSSLFSVVMCNSTSQFNRWWMNKLNQEIDSKTFIFSETEKIKISVTIGHSNYSNFKLNDVNSDVMLKDAYVSLNQSKKENDEQPKVSLV